MNPSDEHAVEPSQAIVGRLIRFAGDSYQIAGDVDLIKARATAHWHADAGLRKQYATLAAYIKHVLTKEGISHAE